MVLENGLKKIEYKDVIPGIYSITESGHVFNRFGKELTPFEDKDGYLRIYLSTNTKKPNGKHKRKEFSVARLVAVSFIGLPPVNMKDPTVDHIDGDVKNNIYTNLRWMERGENSSCRNNTPKGGKNHFCTTDEKTIHEICRMLEDYTNSYTEIAKATGVTKSSVCCIARRKTWAHISKNYLFPDRNRKSSTKDKERLGQITRRANNG
jgi:hypothetical protein